MKRISVHLCVRLILASLALFTFCAFAPKASAMDDGYAVAMSLNLSGTGKGWSSSEDYARELYQRFIAAKGEVHLIVYDWKDSNQKQGRHAFVVYRDQLGKYWAMDNRRSQPFRLIGTAPLEWLKSFADENKSWLVQWDSDLKLIGQASNLDRHSNTAQVIAMATAPSTDLVAR